MKKIVFACIYILALQVSLQAQDISSVILSMPDDFMLRMSEDQKELLAAAPTPQDSTNITATNLFGKEVVRTAVSADYAVIKTSDAGTIQIKLLPLINDSYIIGVIRTVCDMACDSRIEFYTTDWKLLDGQTLFPSKSKDWFIDGSADRKSEDFESVYGFLDMTPIKFFFDGEKTNVTAVYDIKAYLSDDNYKLLAPFLSNAPVLFEWDRISFKK